MTQPSLVVNLSRSRSLAAFRSSHRRRTLLRPRCLFYRTGRCTAHRRREISALLPKSPETGRYSRLPGCLRRVFFVAEERERGLRRTCRESTGPSVRPPSVRTVSFHAACLEVGGSKEPRTSLKSIAHSRTLWPRLHTVPNLSESELERFLQGNVSLVA